MALTQTSLSAAITPSQLRIPISSTATGFPQVGTQGIRQLVQVDVEKMLMVGVPAAGFIDVAMRGYDNSAPVAHDVLAPVFTSANPSDFAQAVPGQTTMPTGDTVDQVTIGQDTTFVSLPNEDTVYNIAKASAAAIVLPASALGAPGVRYTFISAFAAAHTITYAPGFFGDTTASDVATFPVKTGASLVLEVLPSGALGVVGGSPAPAAVSIG